MYRMFNEYYTERTFKDDLPQTFDTIGISVLLDITNMWKKSTVSRISKTNILRNNNAEKLLTNLEKNCPINNQVTYAFFYSKRLYWFLFLKIWKNERNFTNFRYLFVTRFYIIRKNFLRDLIINFHGYSFNFCLKTVFS